MRPLRGRSAFARFAIVVAAGSVIAACNAAPASPEVSVPVRSAAVGGASPSTMPPSPPAASSSPTPTPPASPPTTASPSIALAPGGWWARVAWTKAGPILPLNSKRISVYGWSGGFVAVGMSGGDLGNGQSPLAFSVASSSDGIRWAAARPLDSRGLDPSIQVAGLVQGPTGLLLVGRPAGNTCGGPPTVAALWSSRDGLTWRRVAWPRVFGSNRVQTLDAGSAGDIATGLRTDGRTPAIWLSTDGVAWRSAPLPQISAGRLVVTGATSFAGGLVVAGAVIGPEGCGGASSIHPSIWWSADGASWTREPLSGASNGNDAAMSIVRITDRALVAIERSASPGDRAWLSDDGRTWTRIAAPSTIVEFRLVTDGRHAVAVVRLEGASAPAVIAFHETGSTSTLAETGDRPDPSADGSQWSFAVGPTGILMVRENGGTVWLGHPRN